MEYGRNQNGLIEIALHGSDEVETFRSAFQEYNEYLESLGNDNSVHVYHRGVAGWEGVSRTYRCHDIGHLSDTLERFDEVTEEVVDVILDEQAGEKRLEKAAQRYRLGYFAKELLTDIRIADNTAEGAAHEE